MTYDAGHFYYLMEFVMRAVTAGVLGGVVWSALYRIKTPKGQ